MKKQNGFKKNLIALGLGFMMSIGVASLASCGEVAQYKVNFDTDGGTTYAEITANSGDKVNLPTPEREGYVFGGWYLNEECTGNALTGAYTVTAETTLYAKWTAIQGTVTFESNGGTAYNPVTVSGKVVTLPTPEREDYVFGGWYLTADFTGEAVTGTYAPTGNVTLYAKWTYTHVVVSFNSNGATTHDNLVYEGEALALPTPFKYGYAFEGWFDNADCTGEAVSATAYEPSANITLHAKWSKVTYVYMYYNDKQDYKRFEYKAGDTITVDALEEKFTPAALTTTDLFGSEYEAPFAYWMHEGATEDTHTQVTAPITVGDEHIILIANYDKSNFPGKANIVYNEKDGSYTMTGSTSYEVMDKGTLYGEYGFTLEFTKGASGGVGPAFRMNMTSVDYHHQQGKYISTNLVPATGKLQVCRVDNGFAHLPGSNGETTLSGAWKEYYESAESGSRLKVTMTIILTEDDFEVYYSNFGSQTEPVLIYRFSDVDAPGVTHYYEGLMSKYTDTGFGIRSTGNVNNIISNIYHKDLRKVTFRAEGVEDTIVRVCDGNTTDAYPTPEKAGYALTGWYLDENFETPFDNTKQITEDIIVYGKWEKAIEITFTADGEEVSKSNIIAGATLSELPTLSTKTKQNGNVVTYTLDGWYDGDTKVSTSTVFTESKTLTAKFTSVEKRNDMVVTYDGQGNPQYFIEKTCAGSTGNYTGTVLDGKKADWTVANEYEYSFTTTYQKFDKATGALNFRSAIFVNIDNYLENGRIDFNALAGQGSIWVNFHKGTFIFGNKIDGSTNNTFNVGFDKMSTESAWKQKYNAAVDGEAFTMTYTYRYGVNTDNTAWVKFYIDDELLYTYGLAADAETYTTTDGKTLNKVGGEIVWCKVCNATDTTNANFAPYINGTHSVVSRGNDVALWAWGDNSAHEGVMVTNIYNKPIKANS